jgi:hypothetical protein
LRSHRVPPPLCSAEFFQEAPCELPVALLDGLKGFAIEPKEERFDRLVV